MTHRQLKAGYFTLTVLNTLASSFYFNYLFFFLRDRFGFGDRENLLVSALHGCIYTFAAWQGGKFAERRGFVLSLKLGILGLCVLMIAGAFVPVMAGQLLVIAAYSGVLLLTWPALEALTSERESRAGVQRMIGIYNCCWAGAAALAYFTGGTLYDALGRGAIFGVPAGIFLAQFLLLLWLERRHHAILAATPEPAREEHHAPEAAAFRQPVRPALFLKMAWLANPFAYIGINTLIAVMPGIAKKFSLSPSRVGLFCSVWFFGRFAAFALLWHWRGWHYRFRWLAGAFVLLIGSFAMIPLAGALWLVVAAQAAFGLATGLIYYSSLFYSMDVGETKGEHGGLHEAAIGAGICCGPLIGAGALWFAPGSPNAGVYAVTGLLLAGFASLLWLRFRKQGG